MGLGQGKSCDAFALCYGRQILGLLLIGSPKCYGETAQALHNKVGICLAGDPRQFFSDDAKIHYPNADPAVLLRHAVLKQPLIGQNRHQPGMHRRRFVCFFSNGSNLLLGYAPHSLL